MLRRIDAQLDDTVPATRAITVRDVLTSCMGFGSVMAYPGTYLIQKRISDGQLGGLTLYIRGYVDNACSSGA